MKNTGILKKNLETLKSHIFKRTFLDHVLIPSPANRSPELGQAIIRIGITLIALFIIKLVDYLFMLDSAEETLAINVLTTYLVFTFAYCFLVLRYPNASPLRKYFIIFTDILILSFAIHAFGVSGAPVYPLYIWLVIASGLRFGLHFLHYASAIALSGFSIAVYTSPSWRAQFELAIGLGIAMLIMPLFFLTLLKHLNKTNELLAKKVKETEYMAIHDSLTNLPNRRFLEQKLKTAIQKNQHNEHHLTVLFIDVNSFKFINDTYGHVAGDELIIQFSKRMADCLDTDDMLARLGGDEFMVLLDNKSSADYALLIAERLMQKASGKYQVNNNDIFINFSMGIAHYPSDGDTVETLIKNADTALHYAKKHAKSSFRFYDKQMSQEVRDELTIKTELRKALENNEFELYYQAQLNILTNHVVGAEALLRWNHPQKGLISPDVFMDIAERNSVMLDLGKWTIEQACRERHQWSTMGIENVVLTINVSGRQFMEENFLSHLKNTLKKHQICADQIGLEITERILIEENEFVQGIFKQLKRMNIKLCLDDFGTGYSSLSYLKRFPIDTIKIDRSFINDIPYDEDACSLVKAILAIGRSLKMNIIAEGVENQAQHDALKQWGCETIQGYYFNEPLPEKEFLSYLATHTPSSRIIPIHGN